LFAIIASAAVVIPELATQVARWFGVGRGADFLLYILTVVFIGSLALQSRRASELGRNTTQVARRTAIIEAENKYQRV
jgi:small membrane protein